MRPRQAERRPARRAELPGAAPAGSRAAPGSVLALAFAALALVPAAPAHADEPWLLSLDASVLWPPLAPTADRFGWGGAAGAGLYRPLGDALLLGARVRYGLLADGPAPDDPTLDDPGLGDLGSLSLVLRWRPLASLSNGPSRAPGLFVEGGGGGALTGGVVRPQVELGVGVLVAVGDAALGPAVRWQSVFETGNQLEGRPAHVLHLGLELVLLDARPEPAAVEPEAPGDRDGDGIVDPEDACPDRPEDFDAFEDEDGCPEEDNDRDGVLDPVDQCPLEPEDPDGWEDDDGCPERDNDDDGFLDPDDDCPLEAEVVNGIDDDDGCPDEGLIELINDRIVLEERVLFDFNRARVKTRARPVLQAIVALYRQHPEWTRLRIEGHADVRGSVRFNQYLSELRAQRVRDVLVEYGIPAGIIEAEGFGETRPRAWGSTEPIHQLNRRVEFVVVSRREVRRAVSPGPSGGRVLPPLADEGAGVEPPREDPGPTDDGEAAAAREGEGASGEAENAGDRRELEEAGEAGDAEEPQDARGSEEPEGAEEPEDARGSEAPEGAEEPEDAEGSEERADTEESEEREDTEPEEPEDAEAPEGAEASEDAPETPRGASGATTRSGGT